MKTIHGFRKDCLDYRNGKKGQIRDSFVVDEFLLATNEPESHGQLLIDLRHILDGYRQGAIGLEEDAWIAEKAKVLIEELENQ